MPSWLPSSPPFYLASSPSPISSSLASPTLTFLRLSLPPTMFPASSGVDGEEGELRPPLSRFAFLVLRVLQRSWHIFIIVFVLLHCFSLFFGKPVVFRRRRASWKHLSLDSHIGNFIFPLPTPLVFNLGKLERESDFWFLDMGFHKQICELMFNFWSMRENLNGWVRICWIWVKS